MSVWKMHIHGIIPKNISINLINFFPHIFKISRPIHRKLGKIPVRLDLIRQTLLAFDKNMPSNQLICVPIYS